LVESLPKFVKCCEQLHERKDLLTSFYLNGYTVEFAHRYYIFETGLRNVASSTGPRILGNGIAKQGQTNKITLTSVNGRHKRTGQGSDVHGDRALNTGIVVHAASHVELARDVTTEYAFGYDDGGLGFSVLKRGAIPHILLRGCISTDYRPHKVHFSVVSARGDLLR